MSAIDYITAAASLRACTDPQKRHAADLIDALLRDVSEARNAAADFALVSQRRFEALQEKIAQADEAGAYAVACTEVLRRIRAWDVLNPPTDDRSDARFWRGEIDAVLNGNPGAAELTATGSRACGGSGVRPPAPAGSGSSGGPAHCAHGVPLTIYDATNTSADCSECAKECLAVGTKQEPSVTDEMVDRFLSWHLPITALPDACAFDRSYPHRSGTNLLTADEARAMLEHVLGSAT